MKYAWTLSLSMIAALIHHAHGDMTDPARLLSCKSDDNYTFSVILDAKEPRQKRLAKFYRTHHSVEDMSATGLNPPESVGTCQQRADKILCESNDSRWGFRMAVDTSRYYFDAYFPRPSRYYTPYLYFKGEFMGYNYSKDFGIKCAVVALSQCASESCLKELEPLLEQAEKAGKRGVSRR